jgi:hypothetical protein
VYVCVYCLRAYLCVREIEVCLYARESGVCVCALLHAQKTRSVKYNGKTSVLDYLRSVPVE